jgi:hypothetical protein
MPTATQKRNLGDAHSSAVSEIPMGMSRCVAAVAFLAVFAAVLFVLQGASPRRGVWFCGDFETGGLGGWSWDISPNHPAEVVTDPVRKGRYAVRITLAPGDIAASKERAELKVGDKEIELVRGQHGREVWYGFSLFLPLDYAHPPGDQFQILSQWHHRRASTAPRKRFDVTGPPPLAMYLVPHEGQDLLILVSQSSTKAPPRQLGTRPIRRETWNDLVVHVRSSMGPDGFVEAWLNGRPFTAGRMYGPTLYNPVPNYLRLGLYRRKGVPTINHVFYDEVRLGDSYLAVAP